MAEAPPHEREAHPSISAKSHDPDWVDSILEWRWTWPLVRLGLALLFIVSGVLNAVDFNMLVEQLRQTPLKPPELWAYLTIAVQILGSLLVISGRLIWLGAGMLAVFTGLTNLFVHQFWAMSGQAAFAARNEFLEHIATIAGLVLVSLVAEQRSRLARRA